MVQYKLTYFNLRGRGEIARLIFAAAGQEYQDNRVEFAAWPTIKPTTPFGSLPYLDVVEGGKTVRLAQSVTIARYLARKFGLAGKTDLEQAQVDMYADQITDLQNELVRVHLEKDEAKKKEMTEKLTNEILPNNLKIFEKQLAQNNGHLAGDSLSYADLHLFSVLGFLVDQRDSIFQNFPNIKALDEKIQNHPKLKVYLEHRPKTDH